MSENQEQKNENTNPFDELSIGQILKQSREEMQISIAEISKTLKIKERDLLALEQDQISLIASHLYIPGFIKSYARILKIDSNLINKKVKELNIDSNINNKKHRLVNINKKDIHSPNRETFFNAILIFAVFYLLLFFIHQYQSKELITTQVIINEFNKIN